MGSLIEASARDFFRLIARPALYSMIMYALVVAMDRAIAAGVPAWSRLTAEVALGAVVYGAIVYLTKLESLQEVLRHWRERRGSAAPVEQTPQP